MKLAFKKAARIVSGFIILVLLQFLSEKIIHALRLNLPPTILGMIIFALLLNFKIIPIRLVKDICTIAISVLPVLFVPLLVGITVHYHLIKNDLISILAVIILTTFITMILTAIFVDKVMEWTGKKAPENKQDVQNIIPAATKGDKIKC